MDDKLTKQLGNIIIAMENEIGLNITNTVGLAYSQADIGPVVNYMRNHVSRLSAVERSSMVSQLLNIVDPLYKITSIGIFKSIRRLDYSDYASMEAVRDVLFVYTIETNISQRSVAECNVVAEVLHDIDNTRPNFKNSLSYKYLRMFVLLVLTSNYVPASCIATFILTQIGG